MVTGCPDEPLCSGEHGPAGADATIARMYSADTGKRFVRFTLPDGVHRIVEDMDAEGARAFASMTRGLLRERLLRSGEDSPWYRLAADLFKSAAGWAAQEPERHLVLPGA